MLRKAIILSIIGLSVLTLSACTSNDNSSTKSGNKTEKVASKSAKQIRDLNHWFKNDYKDQTAKEFKKDGEDYYTTDFYKKDSVIEGFEEENGDLMLVVSKNRMDAEGFSAEEIAKDGFNVVLQSYDKDLKGFKNITDNTHNNQKMIKYDITYK